MSQNIQIGTRKRSRANMNNSTTTGPADNVSANKAFLDSFEDTRTNNLLDEMFARQNSFLSDNLRNSLDLNQAENSHLPRQHQHQLFLDNENAIDLDDEPRTTNTTINNINNNNSSRVDEDADDDIIFIKEQPIQFSSPLILPSSSSNNNNAANTYITTPKKFKKQRTISLPQLPLSKLSYQSSYFSVPDQNNAIVPRVTQTENELLHLTGSCAKTLEGNKAVNLTIAHSTSPFYNPPLQLEPPPQPLPPQSTFKKQIGSSLRKFKSNSSSESASSSKSNFKTDKDGHYVYQENDVFGSGGRFIVKDLLGQGTFGKVLKCIDNKYEPNYNNGRNYVAVKVIRAVDRYREAAKTELRILQTILNNDPQGQFQCLLLRECFDYKNHICLVTDLYGKSIYDFMCSNGIARFPGSHIQAIARQLIRSVCFLHDLGIIHTDLKPENILICDETHIAQNLPPKTIQSLSKRRREASKGKHKILNNPEVKIIDFGSAIFHYEYHPPVISTRHYRAPEIVLGLGWSFPCDIWSIACVLVELVIGESLYPIHENLEHMAMMQRINGTPFPTDIIDKMFYKSKHKLGNSPSDLNSTVIKHFDKKSLTLQWPEKNKRGETVTTEKSMKRVLQSCDRLDIYISKILKLDYGDSMSINWNLPAEKNWSLINSKMLWKKQIHSSSAAATDRLDKETFLFWYWFIDLLRKMFEFDPTKRITAKDALDHEWFNLGILDDGIANYNNTQG
ncbi:serine/threonine protein kinase KNS1 [Saccharomyces eubayanus]|uniref:serine/threonine protein kinase KNS1 n=1 Tax=Saccharomyces eubayanus TaxID=1080349 RepID=UPI0006C0346C|nr:KNS1-like protein [Saccharomyces eubayanus]KOG97697.1 KNS1-like protein [Saccharomyces eubayanus]